MGKFLYFMAGFGLAMAVNYFWGAEVAPAPEIAKPVLAGDIFIDLQEMNDSGESGRAGLIFLKDKIELGLDLTGAPYGSMQPAYIQKGNCEKTGEIFQKLTFPTTGSSKSILEIPVDSLKAALPLAITVRKSFAEEDAIVACGEIKL